MNALRRFFSDRRMTTADGGKRSQAMKDDDDDAAAAAGTPRTQASVSEEASVSSSSSAAAAASASLGNTCSERDDEKDDFDNEICRQYPVIPPVDRIPVGTCIYKEFPTHGWYYGEVDYMTFGNRFYRIKYDDGDEEDMLHEHVLKFMVKAGANKSNKNNNNKRAPSKSPQRKATKKQKQQKPRRSTRERNSTIIHVDGHAVKKENNYEVMGLSYKFGVITKENNNKKKKKRNQPTRRQTKKAPATSSSQSQQLVLKTTKPHPVSQLESNRKSMKAQVESNVQSRANLRANFLRQHVDTLKPFIEPKTLQKLQQQQVSSSSSSSSNDAPIHRLVQEMMMQPDSIAGDMRDYQLQGLNWMSSMYQSNVGMILGDEMGLGKSLQTIALICHLKERFHVTGPSLVVCPLSVLYSWCNELTKWAPTLKFLRFHSSSPVDIMHQDLTEYDVVVTTYEMAKMPTLARLWAVQHFHLLVLDEGHRIKSAETLVSQAVRKIHCDTRVILTGTPLANDLVELWSLLNFLVPDVFTKSDKFAQAFDLTHNVVDPVKLQQAHDVLKLFMLRRLKSEVEKLMPPKLETKVLCPLSNMQIWLYKGLLLKDLNMLANSSTGGGGSNKAKTLNNLVMQLRKCCIHPFLFDGVEDPDQTSLEELVGASGKLSVLDLLLCSLYEKNHRVVLFSQFTRVLDILEDYCVLRGWKFCRFDGGTARAKRNFIVNSFNAPDSEKFVFLMSTRSGGMGLNLQTADTCIIFDSDWNPQPDIQAMARVHRIGQTKTVHVYRLITDGTVEQRIVERAEKKLYLDKMVTQDGAAGVGTKDDSQGDEPDADRLLHTLRFGCSAVFGQGTKKQVLPTKEDIEAITDRARTENTSIGNLKGGAESSIEDYDASKALVSTTDFLGIDFKKIREDYQKQHRPNDIGELTNIWQKKRERKNRIKMVDGSGSGYGASSIPVLAANDYDLESGEKSVFDRELFGRNAVIGKKKKHHVDFVNQGFCQVCYEGGELVLCPRCPVSLHLTCAGISNPKQLLCCSQHHCSVCDKSASAAGGFLFVCASACTHSFCEDHIPDGARHLEEGSSRFDQLGYSLKNGVFIYCSKGCEDFAIKELNWEPPSREVRPRCPSPLDISSKFGGEVDDKFEAPENEEGPFVIGKRRRQKNDGREFSQNQEKVHLPKLKVAVPSDAGNKTSGSAFSANNSFASGTCDPFQSNTVPNLSNMVLIPSTLPLFTAPVRPTVICDPRSFTLQANATALNAAPSPFVMPYLYSMTHQILTKDVLWVKNPSQSFGVVLKRVSHSVLTGGRALTNKYFFHVVDSSEQNHRAHPSKGSLRAEQGDLILAIDGRELTGMDWSQVKAIFAKSNSVFRDGYIYCNATIARKKTTDGQVAVENVDPQDSSEATNFYSHASVQKTSFELSLQTKQQHKGDKVVEAAPIVASATVDQGDTQQEGGEKWCRPASVQEAETRLRIELEQIFESCGVSTSNWKRYQYLSSTFGGHPDLMSCPTFSNFMQNKLKSAKGLKEKHRKILQEFVSTKQQQLASIGVSYAAPTATANASSSDAMTPSTANPQDFSKAGFALPPQSTCQVFSHEKKQESNSEDVVGFDEELYQKIETSWNDLSNKTEYSKKAKALSTPQH